jgi:(E)-4-hydroxy-3-methylbut-2-enyl-diphosphate synthase
MAMIPRRATRLVRAGTVGIGGNSLVSVQAMAKTDTSDIEATVRQVRALAAGGARLVRLAVPDEQAALALAEIKKRTTVPLVADIHFDWHLALRSLESGADKLRINPGNLGGREPLAQVAKAARDRCVPIRVGVNAGSLERDLLAKYGGPAPEAIADSALRNVSLLLDLGFEDIVISAKSSDTYDTVAAYRIISSQCDYPLHIGITETGPGLLGITKSAVGIGALLAEGIGDTIRVSLTGPPEDEVRAGKMILRSLGLMPGLDIISCPTCGRCRQSIIPFAEKVASALEGVEADVTVAVMGCEVNGPGEAKQADIGLALTRGGAVLFERGKVVLTGDAEGLVDEMIARVKALGPKETGVRTGGVGTPEAPET